MSLVFGHDSATHAHNRRLPLTWQQPAGLALTLVVLAGLGPTLSGQPVASTGIEGEIDGPKALQYLYGNYDAAKKQSRSKNGWSVVVHAIQNAVVDGKQQWYLYTVERHGLIEGKPECDTCSSVLSAAM